MSGNAGGDGICGIKALSRKRAIGAKLTRQARQEPGCTNIGKEADADLGHGEREPIARHAMRAMHRNADAAAHDDTVNQRHIRLAIEFDLGVKRILRTKEIERFILPPGAPQVVERAQIAAGGESATAIRGYDHSGNRGIRLPPREPVRELGYHRMRYRVERMRPIENDVPRRASALEQDVRLRGHPDRISGPAGQDIRRSMMSCQENEHRAGNVRGLSNVCACRLNAGGPCTRR